MNVVDCLINSDLNINIKNLNKLKKSIKNNFEKINEVSIILDKYPFLKNDIKNRMNSGILFQPGRIVETLIIQLVANTLECKYIENGIYQNDKYEIIQQGGSGKSDMLLRDKENNTILVFEIKEPISYGKSCGFIYNNYGEPIEFTSKDYNYKNYIKNLFSLNNNFKTYNILENIGHNKTFDISDILTNEFDYIISYNNMGKLFIMGKNEYINKFTFKIEIRSCGRNKRKVFTKEKLKIINNYIKIEKDEIVDIKQRGGDNSSRYKYIKNNATFSFNKKDLIENNGQYLIHIDKVKQHVGEISIKHFIKKT